MLPSLPLYGCRSFLETPRRLCKCLDTTVLFHSVKPVLFAVEVTHSRSGVLLPPNILPKSCFSKLPRGWVWSETDPETVTPCSFGYNALPTRSSPPIMAGLSLSWDVYLVWGIEPASENGTQGFVMGRKPLGLRKYFLV